jgi:hypothetical protein
MLIALIPAVVAADYPMSVTSCLDNMSVVIDFGVMNDQAFVRVENYEGLKIYCEANFKAGPDRRTRRTTIQPDKHGVMIYSPRRTVTRMYLKVYCSDEKESMKDKTLIEYSCQKSAKD